MDTPYRRHSLSGPLILVAAGFIFLLSNLGIIEGDVWGLIFRFWPVLLIVGGLDGVYRRDGLIGPALLTGLGTVILLTNLGYIAWDIWSFFFQFWPIFIILIGLGIVVRQIIPNRWISALSLILVILVNGAILWAAFTAPVITGVAINSRTIQFPIQQSNQADLIVNPAVGTVRIGSLNDPKLLLSGHVQAGKTNSIDQEQTFQGSTTSLSLKTRGTTDFQTTYATPQYIWDLQINQTVPVNLSVSMGAGVANLNLVDLKLAQLKTDVAVGSVLVNLPTQGSFNAEINQAVGQMTVNVPSALPIKIQISRGLAALVTPNGFIRRGDTFTSPAYNQSGNYATLKISEAVGIVIIRSTQ